ncbi:putative SCAN domain-containing protein SCAND2P [Chanodichthys erythropterus]|uniref:putative SCAN domain-containing protein SCAND2P n=1 Tax=Chanodichthys erythropterus TaxID=933992 RepID=UPI00351F7531
MQASPAAGKPFADIIASLAVLHQEQHRALMDLRSDQERRFEAIIQGQHEDRERFPELDRPGGSLGVLRGRLAPGPVAHAARPAAFGRVAGGSTAAARPEPPGLQRPQEGHPAAGRPLPEQHRQRFRSLELGEAGRPFVLAQQLRDSCRKWLMADGGDAEQMIDRVVLEQFTTRLPKKTAEWVQCHRPTSLDSAIQLAEDHLVACPGVGESLPSVSLSPSLLPLSLSKPVPLPRSRPPGPPRVPPRGRGGTDSRQFVAPRAPPRGAGLATAGLDPAPASPLSPRQSFGPFSATGAAGRSGPACWRCGDPDHFIDRCPVMEVGTLIRVPDDLQVAPGQAGQYQIP